MGSHIVAHFANSGVPSVFPGVAIPRRSSSFARLGRLAIGPQVANLVANLPHSYRRECGLHGQVR